MLTFDQEKHEYRFDGKLVPGVTSLISSLSDFSFVSDEDMEAACYRGTACHLACELFDLGTLNEAALDPAWRPYLDAWVKFKEERSFAVVLNEHRVFHPVLKYAGTLDRFGMLEGKPFVLDIKTSASLSPVIGIQLAAYLEALVAGPEWNGQKKMGRVAVQLKSDGNYVVKEYADSTDWSAFVGLVNLARWKMKHQIKEK